MRITARQFIAKSLQNLAVWLANFCKSSDLSRFLSVTRKDLQICKFITANVLALTESNRAPNLVPGHVFVMI